VINQLVNDASSGIDCPWRSWNTAHPWEMLHHCCQAAALATPPVLHRIRGGTVPRVRGCRQPALPPKPLLRASPAPT